MQNVEIEVETDDDSPRVPSPLEDDEKEISFNYKLIALVRSKPILWKTMLNEFKDINKKNNA